jgi:hypothetical protein
MELAKAEKPEAKPSQYNFCDVIKARKNDHDASLNKGGTS